MSVADRKGDSGRAAAAAGGRPRPLATPLDHNVTGRIARFRSQDGITLAARIFDAPPSDRLPLLCLPGLSRNSRDFIALGRHFSGHPAEPRRVVAVDYRGRGLSDPDPHWRNYRPDMEANDVLAAMAVLGIEEGIFIGTSRGGLIAMLLGALRPGLMAGVVLNDIGPVLEGTGLARIKRNLDALHPASGWNEAIAALRHGIGPQFPALSMEDWRATAEAYFAQTAKGLVPQFDRNLLRAIADLDFSDRIPVLWPQFMSLARVPLLAIRGEFSDVLSADTLAEMAERHPDFEEMTVRGQGHAPLLRDMPSLNRILAFARRCEESRG